MTATSPQSPTAEPEAGPFTRPGLGRGVAVALVLLGIALHAGQLAGPFRDGQVGNCGAMFALFARNAEALGAPAVLVPVVNPVPPAAGEQPLVYTHHPPGLPWLVMLANWAPGPIQVGARLIALACSLLTALLLADFAARLAGRKAAWATGLLALLLPAGLHHGLLVNYETVALPGLLALTRVLLLERGKAALTAALALLADWVAVLPLGFVLLTGRVCAARWWRAAGTVVVLGLGVVALGRQAAPAAPGETLQQALMATFLSPHFSWAAWWDGLVTHLGALYGWALVPASLALPALPRRSRLLRRVLVTLLGVGVFNVVAFAFHATSHEHFSLLLLPYVALATGTLLFPRDEAARPAAPLAALLLLGLLALGVLQARRAWPPRHQTHMAERAAALAAVTDTDTLYVLPQGAPLVFLHAAARHVAPEPVFDLAGARAAARRYAERVGRDDLPVVLAAWGDSAPGWSLTLGEARHEGGWTFVPLPE